MTLARRILVVEDMQTQALRMRHLLLNAEVESVVVVESAQDGIKLLTHDVDFDCILADIYMPDMDGFEFCQHVKRRMADAKHIPIYMLVSLKQRLDAVKSIESGADNIILKEYDKEFFVQQISAALENSRSESANTNQVFFVDRWYDINMSPKQLAATTAAIFSICLREKAARLRESAKL